MDVKPRDLSQDAVPIVNMGDPLTIALRSHRQRKFAAGEPKPGEYPGRACRLGQAQLGGVDEHGEHRVIGKLGIETLRAGVEQTVGRRVQEAGRAKLGMPARMHELASFGEAPDQIDELIELPAKLGLGVPLLELDDEGDLALTVGPKPFTDDDEPPRWLGWLGPLAAESRQESHRRQDTRRPWAHPTRPLRLTRARERDGGRGRGSSDRAPDPGPRASCRDRGARARAGSRHRGSRGCG